MKYEEGLFFIYPFGVYCHSQSLVEALVLCESEKRSYFSTFLCAVHKLYHPVLWSSSVDRSTQLQSFSQRQLNGTSMLKCSIPASGGQPWWRLWLCALLVGFLGTFGWPLQEARCWTRCTLFLHLLSYSLGVVIAWLWVREFSRYSPLWGGGQ